MSSPLEDLDFPTFERLCATQLKAANVPSELWNAVFQKLKHQEFDAGESFGLTLVDDDDEEGPRGILALNDIAEPTEGSFNVWIVDHAWTFRDVDAVRTLQGSDALRTRVGSMLLGPRDGATATVDDVLGLLWKRARHYSFEDPNAPPATSASAPARVEAWYVADEVGTAILPVVTDEDANVCIAPLYFAPLQCAFDIVWPTRAIVQGEMLYYNVARGFPEEVVSGHPRWSKVWIGGDDEDEMDKICLGKHRMSLEVTQEREAGAPRIYHDVALGTVAAEGERAALAEDDGAQMPEKGVKVFTDHPVVTRSLTKERFEIVKRAQEAHIVWLATPMAKGFAQMVPNAKFVSQFSHENFLCQGAHRATITEHAVGQPAWLPRSFDAATRADMLVGYINFEEAMREANAVSAAPAAAAAEESSASALKRAWVLRPDANAPSLITTDLDLPLRAGEVSPALIQELVRKPATLSGVKFSLSYTLLVRSWQPLDAWTMRVAYPRFASAPLAADNDDCLILLPDVHLTREVNLPGEPGAMSAEAFARLFNDQYGSGAWEQADTAIRTALFEQLAAISHSQGREMQGEKALRQPAAGALYAADVVLDAGKDDSLQPKILSVDFMPGCERAVSHDSDFFAKAFDVLYGGRTAAAVKLVHALDANAASGSKAASGASLD